MDKYVAINRVELIRGLEDNWDSYGSIPFKDAICDNTISIIELLWGESHHRFIIGICPCSGGESIQIELQNRDKFLEIEVFKNKVLYLKAIEKEVDSEEYEEGEFELGKNDKNNISDLINWLNKD